MITITEQTPKKLSGITSLFITFKYNPEVIAIIKNWDKYIYNSEDHSWELPVNSLSYLLDELTYYDDITLVLEKENNKEILYPKLIDKYKTKPFKHQIEGIQWGLNLDNGGLLLDEMGLGKSLQVIYLAEELKEQKGLEHCLIICGINTLKSNWKSEIEKHSNLTCRIIGQKISKKGNVTYKSIKERAQELKEPLEPFFYILNIEALRFEEIVDAIKKSKNKIDLIVFDECHKCLDYNTLIDTNQGKLKIGDIVTNKIDCLVKCKDNRDIVYKKIKNYYELIPQNKLLSLTIEENNKIYNLICTEDHKIYTKNRGYIQAKNIKETDNILISDEFTVKY